MSLVSQTSEKMLCGLYKNFNKLSVLCYSLYQLFHVPDTLYSLHLIIIFCDCHLFSFHLWKAFLQHWKRNFSTGSLHTKWNGIQWRPSFFVMSLLIIIEWEFIHLTRVDIHLWYIERCRRTFLQHRYWKNLVSLYDYTFLDNSNGIAWCSKIHQTLIFFISCFGCLSPHVSVSKC